MKKKTIEKIPYIGLRRVIGKKDVKYVGVTSVKTIGNEEHLIIEVYRNEKEALDVPVVPGHATTANIRYGTGTAGNTTPRRRTWSDPMRISRGSRASLGSRKVSGGASHGMD